MLFQVNLPESKEASPLPGMLAQQREASLQISDTKHADRAKTIYGICQDGLDGQTVAKFISRLQRHGIQLVVDVRPRVQRCWPQFRPRTFERCLNAEGIEYDSVRELRELRSKLTDYVETWDLWQPFVFVWDCHYHSLLKPALLDLGYRVIQI